ncbi:hypothetical protein [Streptomyces nanshensis]|uniref:Uncharacterized protein n=1 Tax=Streptomyces nanshensis TaxID=518642 RepID=A0A1E7LD54_9ACTN|nr:hypothetical protein [Streptomyces nanshensis]OEV13903.1 hypothetical protein AN218_01380 [Streptomyces nanshensis]
MGPSENREEREAREGTAVAAAGCLIALLAAATGLGVWLYGAVPALRGGFEGERDPSLLYIELPAMAAGFPLLALLTWSLTRAVMRAHGSPGARRAVQAAVVVLTLLLLSGACWMWLGHRVETLLTVQCSDPPC